MMDRRRALMGAKNEEPNRWKPGVYNNGTSVATINEDGVFEITRINSASANRIYPQFERPLKIQTGDTIQVKFAKLSGTKTSTSVVCYLGSNHLTSSNGESWGANINTLTLNLTATANDNNRTNMTWGASALNLTGTNCKIKVEIFINGEQVI